MSGVTHREFSSFAEFYPVYLSEHVNRTNREMHFAGATLTLLSLFAFLLNGSLWWLLAAVFFYAGFSLYGHFAFEPNQPRTYRHPFYSFIGGWVIYWQMLTGQDSF